MCVASAAHFFFFEGEQFPMGVNVLSVKCPACGANLPIEEGRTQVFCSYCGNKVVVTNENEYIYRHIDEASVKQAETDRIVLLHQLQQDEKDNESRKKLIIVRGIAVGILLVLGIVGLATENIGLMSCLMIAMPLGIGIHASLPDKRKRRAQPRRAGENEVVISDAMAWHTNKNYQNVIMLFKSAGFQNVSAYPLKDLNLFTQKQNGKVEDVTINGSSDFSEGDVFNKQANIIITYHSM